jgi:uncharacterized protein (DUF885 family)
MNRITICLCLVITAAPCVAQSNAPTKQGGSSSTVQQLHQLFDERFQWQMQEFPEEAMSRGDYSHADRVTDASLAAIQRRHDQTAEHLQRLLSIDKSQLPEQELINYEIFELELQNSVNGQRFRRFLAPVGGRFGPQQAIPQMGERVRFNHFEDYANYLTRLLAVPKMVDNTIELMREGLKENRTPPKIVLEGVPQQFDKLLKPDGLKALAEPFDRFPESVNENQRAELRRRFDNAALPAVRKALAKLNDFFVKEYLPNTRATIAAIDWPEGEEFYNHQLRVMTTTDLTARQIHEIGLREVKRIRSEMMQVIRRSDFQQTENFKTLANGNSAAPPDDAIFRAFIDYLRTDPRFYHKTERELIMQYRDICKQVDAWLPKFFKTLPRLPYGVKEMAAFMAPQQTTAYYQSGDIRNAEPGYFVANTYDLSQRPKYEMIPLAMHEAVPGHHLQIALAQEIEGLPEFRKDAWFNAYGEGWALYSERLGIEMGLYEDPYDDFGRLLYEMWRACRLVVDPGMHALGWTREQAIQFMLDNTALSELNITTEVDRYIAWPGQAVSYKIGELKIRELRAKAENELGAKFDIREFHDVVLGAGAIPLNVLERRVNEWIAAQAKSN